MSETVIVLSDEDREELSLVISENVLEVEPTAEFLDAFIEREPDLMLDGVKWGFNDTVVRENVASHCAVWLVGQKWPTYGEKWSPERFSKFEEDLKNAYAAWVASRGE